MKKVDFFRGRRRDVRLESINELTNLFIKYRIINNNYNEILPLHF